MIQVRRLGLWPRLRMVLLLEFFKAQNQKNMPRVEIKVRFLYITQLACFCFYVNDKSLGTNELDPKEKIMPSDRFCPSRAVAAGSCGNELQCDCT